MNKVKNLILFFIFSLSFSLVFIFTSKNTAAAPASVARLSGMDRYETNIAVIENGWTSAPNVVIASGEDFPDALCAAPLAKLKSAPIILTGKSQLNDDTINELKKLKTQYAYIIGGTGVISPYIEQQLESLKISYIRIAGQNRFETSVKVAEEVGTDNGIAVASGQTFPDALSIAPIAAKLGMPILLSTKDVLPSEINNLLKDKNIPRSYIIGGTGVLSDNIQSSLPNTVRLSGLNRYETNINILKEFESSLDSASLYVASGSDFPDALSGSTLAANLGAPIILVDKTLSDNTSYYLKKQNYKTINILGGSSAVTPDVINEICTTTKYLTITHVDDTSDIAFINENYNFPPHVLAAYDDSSTKLIPVKWNSAPIDTSKPGSYTFNGRVQGYSENIKLNLKVIEDTGSLNGNLVNGGDVAYYKGNIYYSNLADDNKLYRLDSTTSSITKLNDDLSGSINVAGDFIYYINATDSGTVWRMKLNGLDKTRVLNHQNVSSIVASGNALYYSYSYDGTSAFCISKADGSSETKLNDDLAYEIVVSDGYIYYRNHSDNDSIYRLKLDGSEKLKITEDSAADINVVDGTVYYINSGDSSKLYRISGDGTSRTKIADAEAARINVYNGWIYYSNINDGGNLYRVRCDGTSDMKFANQPTDEIIAYGDWIIYKTRNDNPVYYAIKLDGSVNMRFGVKGVIDDEPNDTPSTSVNYKLANCYAYTPLIMGCLTTGDTDVYKLQSDYSNNLNVYFESQEIADTATLTLINSSGSVIYSTRTKVDGSASFIVKNVLPGSYYLKVTSSEGSIIDFGTYEVSAWLATYSF